MSTYLKELRAKYLNRETEKHINEYTVCSMPNKEFLKDSVATNLAVFDLLQAESRADGNDYRPDVFDRVIEIVTPMFEAYPDQPVNTDTESVLSMLSPWAVDTSTPAEYALCVTSSFLETDEFTIGVENADAFKQLIEYALSKGVEHDVIADMSAWLSRDDKKIERVLFDTITHEDHLPVVESSFRLNADIVFSLSKTHDIWTAVSVADRCCPVDPRFVCKQEALLGMLSGEVPNSYLSHLGSDDTGCFFPPVASRSLKYKGSKLVDAGASEKIDVQTPQISS